jgi:iron complex outermembrane recepter protein
LNYSGVGNFYQGDSAVIRGVRAGMMTDGAADTNFDNISLDSITVLRGPIGVLYGFQGTLGGAVIKNTKVPLEKPLTVTNLKVDQWGYMRAEVDQSRPLGQLGKTKVSYRVAATHQIGNNFLDRMEANRSLIFGVVEFSTADSVLRLNAQWQALDQYPHKANFLAPSGKPYVGAGRAESYEPKQTQNSRYFIFRSQYIQRVFDNWGLTIRAVSSRQKNDPIGVILAAGGLNYQTGKVGITARRNDFDRQDYAGTLDIKGEYRILGFKTLTMAGGLFTSLSNFGSFQGDAFMGARNGQTGGIFLVPMDLPNVGSWNVLKAADYVLPTLPAGTTTVTAASPNQGSTAITYTWTEYFQQNIEVIPNRLTLVGSIAHSYSTSRSEIKVVPSSPVANRVTSHATQSGDPLRLGVVFNVTKDVALYALNSQFFEVQLSRLIDGGFTPPRVGDGKEIGLKADLFDGRVSATLSAFDNEYTNNAISAGTGVISPITGLPYSVLVDGTSTKGWDLSLFTQPLPNWQLSVSVTNSKVRNPANLLGFGRLPFTFEHFYSFLTRYDFKTGGLRNFSVGGGAWYSTGRVTAAGTFIYPNGQNFEPGMLGNDGNKSVADGGQARAFVEYRASRTLRADIDNLFDELTMVGSQAAFIVDVSPPRTVSFRATYRF